MNIEVFTQRGYKTVFERNVNGHAIVSFDYTGSAVRELDTDYKKMVSKSGSLCDISKMTNSLALIDKRNLINNPGFNLTGNARRESYLHYPSPRMYRTYAQNGKSLPSQAIGEIEYGFYVEEISSEHYSRLSGKVTCNASKARIVKNGIVTENPATFLITHFSSSPLNIRHISNDIKILPGGCNAPSGKLYVEIDSPTMSIDDLYISDVYTYKSSKTTI